MRTRIVHAIAITIGLTSPFLIAHMDRFKQPAVSWAADTLKIDGLPNDPRQFRTSVDPLIAKVDKLIEKLKATPNAPPIVLDLIQTRDNVLREIVKIEATPGDAKWTPKEMRESVESMLKLMKDQYDKASAMGG